MCSHGSWTCPSTNPHKIGSLLGDEGSWDSRLLHGCIPSAVLSLEQVQELFVEWMMEEGKEGRGGGGGGGGGVGG